MITIFNRKELLITFDMEKFANVRDDLKNAGIEFQARSKPAVMGHSMTNRKTIVPYTAGSQYYIYVKESDYQRASHIVYGKGR